MHEKDVKESVRQMINYSSFLNVAAENEQQANDRGVSNLKPY